MIALALFLSFLLLSFLTTLLAILGARSVNQWFVLVLFFSIAVLDGVAFVVAVLGSWTL